MADAAAALQASLLQRQPVTHLCLVPLQEFTQKQRHARSDSSFASPDLLPSSQQASMWDSTSTFDFVDTPSDLPAGKCPCISADMMSEAWGSKAEQHTSRWLRQGHVPAGLAAGYQLGTLRPERRPAPSCLLAWAIWIPCHDCRSLAWSGQGKHQWLKRRRCCLLCTFCGMSAAHQVKQDSVSHQGGRQHRCQKAHKWGQVQALSCLEGGSCFQFLAPPLEGEAAAVHILLICKSVGGVKLLHYQTCCADSLCVSADHPEHPDNQYTPFPSFPPSGDANELRRLERWQRHQQRPLEEHSLNTRADPWSGLAEVHCSWQLGLSLQATFRLLSGFPVCRLPKAVWESCLGVRCFAVAWGPAGLPLLAVQRCQQGRN